VQRINVAGIELWFSSISGSDSKNETPLTGYPPHQGKQGKWQNNSLLGKFQTAEILISVLPNINLKFLCYGIHVL